MADTRFPAERCATDTAVLATGAGRHVMVTEYVQPTPAPRQGFVLAWCAALLGRLATRPAHDLPAGGGRHRLSGTPSAEIDAALRLGGQLGPSVAELTDALGDADNGTDLPEALIHPDLTPPNAVPQGDQPPVVIDWMGVGRGPRVWPLTFLLFTAGPAGARRALDRYTRSVLLTEQERHRLPGIMIARPLSLGLGSLAYDCISAQQAIARCRAHHARVRAVATALNDPDRP